MTVIRCLPSLLAALFFYAVPAALAQYMYLDSNGNGVHDAGDVLNENGNPTPVDIYLVTNVNADSSAAYCSSDSSMQLAAFGYSVNLLATEGTVTFSGFSNQVGTFPVAFGEVNPGDERYKNGFSASQASDALSVSGAHRLASLTITGVSGTPQVNIVANLAGVPDPTFFGTSCLGTDLTGVYTLGTDWSDVDGLGKAIVFGFYMEVEGDGVGGSETVTTACIPGSSQSCTWTAYPSRYPRASQGGCKEFTDSVTLFCTVSFTCNGQVAKGEPITAEVYAKQLTGGHCHADPSRPTASPWRQDGVTDASTGLWQFELRMPEVAGVLNLVFYSTSTTCPFNSQRDTLRTICVKVPGLIALPENPSYGIWQGGFDNEERHPDFHYGTINTVNALRQAAEEWQAAFPGKPLFSINDISLEWGGVFDIDTPGFSRQPLGSYPNWISPHCGHRFGLDVDVRLGNQARKDHARIVEWFNAGRRIHGLPRKRFLAAKHGDHLHLSLYQ